jgi:hypothetical protein
MIRQAQTYLHGAASGAGLVAAAVVGFVLLVWLSPFHGLPLPSLGFGADGITPASERSLDSTPAAHRAGAGGVVRRTGGRKSSAQANSNPAKPGQDGSPKGGQNVTTHSDLGSNPGAGPAPQGPGRDDPAPQGGGGSGGGAPSGLQVGDTTVNSQAASDAANGVVDTVDQATGGALDQTGVSDTAHGVIDGAVGPGSTAGGAVDGALGAVGGALGGSPGSR